MPVAFEGWKLGPGYANVIKNFRDFLVMLCPSFGNDRLVSANMSWHRLQFIFNDYVPITRSRFRNIFGSAVVNERRLRN